MSYEEVQKVWMNGRLVDFADAKIHSFSHVFHYGSAMFEGTRVYDTRNGPAAFRLDDHIERLYHSCKVYRMEIPYTPEELRDAIFETIRANGFGACYIRPVVYRGLGALGVNPFKSPVDVVIAVWHWGQYLGEDAVQKGVDVCVSSWNRMAPNTFPAMAKATGNYLNSALIKMEALANGYEEGIALDKPTYGIHGTPEPSTIGRAESHGCIRMTNWDVLRLSQMMKPGFTALFQA